MRAPPVAVATRTPDGVAATFEVEISFAEQLEIGATQGRISADRPHWPLLAYAAFA